VSLTHLSRPYLRHPTCSPYLPIHRKFGRGQGKQASKQASHPRIACTLSFPLPNSDQAIRKRSENAADWLTPFQTPFPFLWDGINICVHSQTPWLDSVALPPPYIQYLGFQSFDRGEGGERERARGGESNCLITRTASIP